jgi:uncharacterized protein (DUF433 family)
MVDLLSRITVDPTICHGQPWTKGTRIMVYLVLELLEAGVTPKQVVGEYYPQLTLQDIEACSRKGAKLWPNP